MPSPFPNLPPYQRGAVHTQLHASVALRENPWGDPSERELLVWLPPGYEHTDQRYPAVLFLSGFAAAGEMFLARRMMDPALPSVLDRLVEEGCPPFIGVMPDCMTSLGGSQFMDSPGLGDYGTYLAREVRAFVDGRYRTTGRWGAVGHSSGGFGALNLAMHHPGSVEAVACHAGDMGFDLCYLGDIPRAVAGIQAAGGLDAFLQRFWEEPDPSGDAFAALNMLAMSCAYSPAPDASPVPACLPFDPATGEIAFEVLQRWGRHDPVRAVDDPQIAAHLAALRLLWIDAGNKDEHGLHLGARRLVARLRALGVGHVHEEFKGSHRGLQRRYAVSVPPVVRALVEAPSAAR